MQPQQPPFLSIETPWADSVLQSMTIEEKIGQLFSVAAYSNKGEAHQEEILNLIEKYHIGGLTFFQGGPLRQAHLTNIYQSKSKIPLMIAMDGEWGLSMRLDSTFSYPWQMTLGAIENDSLIYLMGTEIAAQFRRLGVHVNFAPVVDVNNNPKNPVINARSFGEDKKRVTAKGIAYMQGMQDGGVLANAKHFPGHGDTDADSHVTLPIVKHDKERIDSIELVPFKGLINSGVGSMMTAHLYLPAFTKNDKKASSLKSEIVDTLLRQRLGYRGLVFTDGLNMGGVANYQASEKNDIDAIIAGNDILLLSQSVEKSFAAIKKAIADQTISEERINQSVHRILKAKEWLGLTQSQMIELEHLTEDLNSKRFAYTHRQLVENAITVVRNKNKHIPISKLNEVKRVNLAISPKGISVSTFQNTLNRYAKVDLLHFNSITVGQQKELIEKLLQYDEVIVSIHKSNKSPWSKYKISPDIKNFLNILRLKKQYTMVVFANAYALENFIAAEHVDALVVAYQNSEISQELTAQILFGAKKAKGKLPISPSKTIKAGMGEYTESLNRIQYDSPESVGINSDHLYAVDEIVKEGIREKAYPGAQVLIAKNGKVIYNKSFGHHTYAKNQEVRESDLYDLASVTKIASTLLAVMRLDGEGKISLEDKLGDHLKMTKGTDYEDLSLKEILAHQAGLAAWIPFYNKTLHKGQPRFDIYSKAPSKKYKVEVAKDLYMIPEYQDTIFYRIINRAKVNPKKEYRYSDIGYYFLKEIVEKITKEDIQEYNKETFYGPMGMHRTTFNPLDKFSLNQIVPTEKDKVFRKQLIHGYVHDPGAAMLGGIGGHAGLFSTTTDLIKLLQMYLDGGTYQNQRFIKDGVVAEYAKCQYCEDSIPMNEKENRRGAGFDKPQFHGNPGPTCECISFDSYGHSGFTGTYAWIDPTEDLIYIFLSNRIYPDANNKKLLSLNIRTRIQEKIYEAVYPERMLEEQSALFLEP